MLRSGASGVNKEAARIDEGSEMVEGWLKDHAKNKARRPSFMMLLACIASVLSAIPWVTILLLKVIRKIPSSTRLQLLMHVRNL